ncbi:MAG: hypothetical protein WCG25_09780 [bacterium]
MLAHVTDTLVHVIFGVQDHHTISTQYRVLNIHIPLSVPVSVIITSPEILFVFVLSIVMGTALSMIKFTVEKFHAMLYAVR